MYVWSNLYSLDLRKGRFCTKRKRTKVHHLCRYLDKVSLWIINRNGGRSVIKKYKHLVIPRRLDRQIIMISTPVNRHNDGGTENKIQQYTGCLLLSFSRKSVQELREEKKGDQTKRRTFGLTKKFFLVQYIKEVNFRH